MEGRAPAPPEGGPPRRRWLWEVGPRREAFAQERRAVLEARRLERNQRPRPQPAETRLFLPALGQPGASEGLWQGRKGLSQPPRRRPPPAARPRVVRPAADEGALPPLMVVGQPTGPGPAGQTRRDPDEGRFLPSLSPSGRQPRPPPGRPPGTSAGAPSRRTLRNIRLPPAP